MRSKQRMIVMERLLHYTWEHRLLTPGPLRTTNNEPIEIIDPGLRNTNAGPDFFNAKIIINETLWVGNIEIHTKSSEWYRHGHEHDEAYANVILHVAENIDKQVYNCKGKVIPQLQISVPEKVSIHYNELIREESYPPCHAIIRSLSKLTIHSWMSALQTERLEEKALQIRSRLESCNGDWENAYFITLARNFGFGINGDVFEEWAHHIPLQAIAKHRDNLFQIEAIFMGQAGLLDSSSLTDYYKEEAMKDGYFQALEKEYQFLSHKFSLTPINRSHWNFLRLRPQNFPHIRLAQLANLYYTQKTGLSHLLDVQTPEEARSLFTIGVSPYWEQHYTFGSTSHECTKTLQKNSLDLLLINTAVPILFAYGCNHMDESICERAIEFLEAIKPENNYITRSWKQGGIEVETAADSQALIQLRKQYCDRKDCLRCRFGYEYLTHKFDMK